MKAQAYIHDRRWSSYRYPGSNTLGLDLIVKMMPTAVKKPKVLLFDIGGVCVVSPFKAILEYEQTHNIPTGYINHAIRASAPDGAWSLIERGEIANNASFMTHFKRDLESPLHWRTFHTTKLHTPPDTAIPSPPSIDVETLYWNMMSLARQNDAFMYPALLKLKEKGWRLAALSNTTVFPPDHPFALKPAKDDVRDLFDVFVSSAHVGMRKPHREIYQYTLEECRRKWPEIGLEMGDVLFLDDIGENLKMGRALGMRTIRVWLGRTREAVRELEVETGESLLVDDGVGEKARL